LPEPVLIGILALFFPSRGTIEHIGTRPVNLLRTRAEDVT